MLKQIGSPIALQHICSERPTENGRYFILKPDPKEKAKAMQPQQSRPRYHTTASSDEAQWSPFPAIAAVTGESNVEGPAQSVRTDGVGRDLRADPFQGPMTPPQGQNVAGRARIDGRILPPLDAEGRNDYYPWWSIIRDPKGLTTPNEIL